MFKKRIKIDQAGVCPSCLITTPVFQEDRTCWFCDSERCTMSFFVPLKEYLTPEKRALLEARLEERIRLKKKAKWFSNERFYLNDYIKSLKAVLNAK